MEQPGITSAYWRRLPTNLYSGEDFGRSPGDYRQDVADFRTISKEKNESHLDLVKPLIGEDSKG